MTKNKKYGYIYKIEIHNDDSSMNGCYYIGQHKYQTKYKDKMYYGSGHFIQKYIKKWGIKGLNKTILCECTSKEELNKKEKYYVNNLYKDDCFVQNGKCLNLKSGGYQCEFNDFIKNKISKSHIGKKVDNKTKEKISKSLKGKFKGLNSFAYGYKHTISAKEKISTFNKGKKLSNQAKQKLRDFHLGRPLSDYHKKRLSEKHANVKGNKNPAFGRRWFTDGNKNFFGYECPEGFVIGMTKKKWSKNVRK